MKKSLPYLLLILVVLITPLVASAVWWNPFTWFTKPTISTPIVQNPVIHVDTNDIPTTTSGIPKENPKATPLPKKIPAIVPVVSSEPTTSPEVVISPTAQEIAEFGWFCDKNGNTCSESVISAFYSSPTFRALTMDAIKKTKDSMGQEVNKSDSGCTSEITLSELRTLSPQQQAVIRSHKCGTSTQQTDLNYKLYQQQEYTKCLIAGNPDYYCDMYKPIFLLNI